MTTHILEREYREQAHHMAKAANSLVNLLNDLDYDAVALSNQVELTLEIHRLIRLIDAISEADEPLVEL